MNGTYYTLATLTEAFLTAIETETNPLQVWSRKTFGEYLTRGGTGQNILWNTTQRLKLIGGVMPEQTLFLNQFATKPVYLFACLSTHGGMEGFSSECLKTPVSYSLIGFCFDNENSQAITTIQDFWQVLIQTLAEADVVTVNSGQFMGFIDAPDIQAFRIETTIDLNSTEED